MIFKYLELSSCVKGERFKYTFKGEGKQNVALLTEEEYKTYSDGCNSVERVLTTSPAVLISKTDDEKLYIVRDLGNKDVPDDWKGSVDRYSPLIAVFDLDKLSGIFKRRMKNAANTDADESMIQYWDENKDKNATIDLTQKTCQCPSCGKIVKTTELDGAHVVLANGSSKTEYITPTCRSCNRSKVNRIFEVNLSDLVLAPEK